LPRYTLRALRKQIQSHVGVSLPRCITSRPLYVPRQLAAAIQGHRNMSLDCHCHSEAEFFPSRSDYKLFDTFHFGHKTQIHQNFVHTILCSGRILSSNGWKMTF
jgi:hypothetical protein